MVSGNALQAWEETMWGQKEFNFEYIDIKGGFENLGINRKKVIKCILEKVWTGIECLRLGYSGRLC